MSGIRARVIRREVILFYLSLALLCGSALDASRHLAGVAWIGRYLGIAGVLFIPASFGYSMRERRLITSGKPVNLRRRHERLAWAGSLLIPVRAGIHINAILA
jgi:hypothetical protein